eukprot:323325_1
MTSKKRSNPDDICASPPLKKQKLNNSFQTNMNGKLQLQNGTVINGLVPVVIINLDDIFPPENDISPSLSVFYECTANYKLIFKQNQPNYQNNQWQSQPFHLYNTAHHSSLYFKVPLFLYSYSLQYNLQIKRIVTEIDADQDTDMNSQIQSEISKNYSVEIPSILVSRTHNVGDRVQFNVSNADIGSFGFIREILDGNQLIIEREDLEGDLTANKIFLNIDSSDVFRQGIHMWLVIDITNKQQAEYDMLLRRNKDQSNEKDFDVYKCLSECLLDIYSNEIEEMYEFIHYEENTKSFSRIITCYIFEYLYCKEYNYRIQCIYDEYYLFIEQQWKYYIFIHYENLKNGGENSGDVQQLHDFIGYTCDLCRVEVCQFDFMYHCDCNENNSHDFCVSCVHSLVLQNNEMKQLLYGILIDIIDDDCIDQIVMFCVGNVIQFDA